MEWTIRLEAKTGWGEVETVEVVSVAHPVLAATADDVGLSLAEANSLLTRLQENGAPGSKALDVRHEAPSGHIEMTSNACAACRGMATPTRPIIS